MTFLDDFARWESGALTREELLARYPQSDKNMTEKNRAELTEKNQTEKNQTEKNGPSVDSELAMILDLHERLT
ncbi:MAG: hypothetical protein ABI595_15740, partial [Actinomycetota bacterium]